MALWLGTAWLIIAGILALAGTGLLLVILWSFVATDAPWVPQPRRGMAAILALLGELPPGAVVVDLGAGDGRVLRAVVRQQPQVRGVGVEQSRTLTAIARAWSRIAAGDRIAFHRGDFLRYPLDRADVVTCYLWADIMPTLGEKFRRELTPGSRVISAGFQIPGWRPSRVVPVPELGACYEYRIGD